MYFRIIRNDIAKNKAISLTITVFVAAAAMLAALAAILTINLVGSVDTLMKQSKTSHFMQMHSGRPYYQQLDSFAEKHDNVEEYQVMEFLNLDSARIIFEGNSLSGSMQDNGLSVQSEAFDFLLDLYGNVIHAENGELYVPISYMRDNRARVGDRAVICGKEFTVAGFLRDSQMNSTLSSSKRFLVSDGDYEELRSFGAIEYLISFRLKDLSLLGAFEAAYSAAGLPANGPAITYPLFKTLNAFSDGIMIGVIFLVSLLVVAVAFMCIRFALLAKIEDDFREIGVMKAIGLRTPDIGKIYLAEYAAITFCGCISGFGLSLALKDRLTSNIRLYMGESGHPSLALLFGIAGILLIFLIIMTYVAKVLKRMSKISAAEAIRFGGGQEKAAGAKHFSLSGSRFLSTNVFLGIKDVLARKSLYATMLFVLVIASFIMIIPQNLYNTISAKRFSSYMGIGNCDLRIDIQQTDNIPEKSAEIDADMSNDAAIRKTVVLTTKVFKTPSGEQLKVELGDHLVFPVVYSEGKAPTEQNDIALSAINAGELSKQVGDTITLYTGGSEKNLTVCGIYSDITNGGKTAKAVFTDDTADTMWSILCAELTNPSLAADKSMEYAARYPFAKIAGIDEYITQTFGQTIRSVRTASYAAVAISLIITLLITVLFMKMLIAKDRHSIAVMKALGFTNRDISVQYAVRSIFVLMIGLLLGTLLANTLGEALAGMAISAFGASSFKFTIDPASAYLLCPVMMAGTVLIGAVLGTSRAGQIKISENIKE